MTIDTQTALQLTRIINVDPATAFDAWTQPEHIRRWSCPEDHTVSDSRVDLTVGGDYKLQMQSPEGTHTARGTYREIDRPHRLVYTWDWDEEGFQMGETVVTVEFQAHEAGTQVTVTHEGFPAPEATEEHLKGWESCLDGLERHLTSQLAAPAAAHA